MILAALTDYHIDTSTGGHFGNVWILAIVVIAVYCIVVVFMEKINPFAIDQSKPSWVLTGIWSNLLVTACLILFVGVTANTDEEDHVRLRIERLLTEKRYNDAILLTDRYELQDSVALMLRSYALAKEGRLGDLFTYTYDASSDLLFPYQQGEVQTLMFSAEDIYRDLGGVPGKNVAPLQMLQIMERDSTLTPMGHDYLLTAYLLDRRLDDFVAELDTASVSPEMPKSHREALIMYNHMRTSPRITFSMPELDTDYEDFRKALGRKTFSRLSLSEQNALRSTYGDTYWFYYFRVKSR